MIHQATQKIADKLAEMDIKFNILENENGSRLICGVNGKTITYRVHFISTDEDNDVAIRVFNLARFPEEKRTDMFAFANECNSNYRFLKFVVDCDDNTLQAEYDIPQGNQNVAEAAIEILVRIMDILNKMGADMMRRIWA